MCRTFFHLPAGIFSVSRTISAVLHNNLNSVNVGKWRLGRRFVSLTLIAALGSQIFLFAPLKAVRARPVLATAPVSSPPEPFVVGGSGFYVAGLELTRRLASKAAALFALFAPSSKKSYPELSTLNSPLDPPPAASVTFDFDGDGRADIGRWKSGNAEFKIKNSNGGSYTTTIIGTSASKPAPADYDGDNKTDAAVFNAGTWTIKQSSNGQRR